MQGIAFWKDRGDNVRRRAMLANTFVAIAQAGEQKEQQQYEESTEEEDSTDEGEGEEMGEDEE
jgi:hypothetical protein